MPQRATTCKLEEICTVCERTPRVSVAKFKPGRPWKLCFNDDCPSMEEMKRQARRAAKAREEAAKEAEAKAAEGTAAEAAQRRPNGRRPRRRREDDDQDQAEGRRKTATKSKAKPRPQRHSESPTSRRVHLARGHRRLGQDRPGAAPGRGAARTLLLREPGGTDTGERVRELIKDPGLAVDPLAELLLFCAARAQLVNEVIVPARGGPEVVCDRFSDSTVAYQGDARGLGSRRRGALRRRDRRRWPDITFFLRLDPEVAAETERPPRAAAADRFEAGGG